MLRCENWWIEDNDAWLFSKCDKTLYKVNMETAKIDYIAQLPAKYFQNFFSQSCFKYRNNIYCIPYNSDCILEFDIESKNWDCIRVPGYIKWEKTDIFLCKIHKEYAYLFSPLNRTVFTLNMINNELEVYITLSENFGFPSLNTTSGGEYLFFISREKPYIYKLNYLTGVGELLSVPSCNYGFNTICLWEKNDYILSGYENVIYRWNLEGITKYQLPSGFGEYLYDKKGNTICRSQSVYTGIDGIFDNCYKLCGQCVFVPWNTNKFIGLDVRNNEIYEIPLENRKNKQRILSKYKYRFLRSYVYKERYIGLLSNVDNIIVEIDVKEKSGANKMFCINNEASIFWNNKFICMDEDAVGLRKYISLICRKY